MDASYIKKLVSEIAAVMQENREYLIQLDSVVGDGDLGLTMSDGFRAAANYTNTSEENDLGKLLYGAGKAMSTAVPSTMGTLMASGLMQAGKVLKGTTDMDVDGIINLFSTFEEGVMHRGKARVGEKTFLDGLDPAIQSLKDSVKAGHDFHTTVQLAYQAAEEGYEHTATMIAVHGRAATRGEASRTLKDPGAKVAVLIMEALKRCQV